MIRAFLQQWETAPLWQRLIIAVVFPVVVAGSLWFYLVSPQKEEIQRLKEERMQKRQELVRLNGLLKGNLLERLSQERDKLLRELQEKQKQLGYVLEVERSPQIFRSIDSIISRNGGTVLFVKTSNLMSEEFPLGENTEKDKEKGKEQQPSFKALYMELELGFVTEPLNVRKVLEQIHNDVPAVVRYERVLIEPGPGGKVYVELKSRIYFSGGSDATALASGQ